MSKISESEFSRICNGIYEDREAIFRHNPIGTREETLLWMLLSCLISYLSLNETEMPCFNGTPDAETYWKAILYVLRDRKTEIFPVEKYLDQMLNQ